MLRNLKKPVLKDTLVVPRGGVAVIRFLADNAGMPNFNFKNIRKKSYIFAYLLDIKIFFFLSIDHVPLQWYRFHL